MSQEDLLFYKSIIYCASVFIVIINEANITANCITSSFLLQTLLATATQPFRQWAVYSASEMETTSRYYL
jgi:hypothetical protein